MAWKDLSSTWVNDVEVWDELYRAYTERFVVSGGGGATPKSIDVSEPVQPYVRIRNLQFDLGDVAGRFICPIQPDGTPIVFAGQPSSSSSLLFIDKLFADSVPERNLWNLVTGGKGLFPRRYTKNPADGGTVLYGYAQAGDIIGAWIFEDIRRAMELLVWLWQPMSGGTPEWDAYGSFGEDATATAAEATADSLYAVDTLGGLGRPFWASEFFGSDHIPWRYSVSYVLNRGHVGFDDNFFASLIRGGTSVASSRRAGSSATGLLDVYGVPSVALLLGDSGNASSNPFVLATYTTSPGDTVLVGQEGLATKVIDGAPWDPAVTTLMPTGVVGDPTTTLPTRWPPPGGFGQWTVWGWQIPWFDGVLRFDHPGGFEFY